MEGNNDLNTLLEKYGQDMTSLLQREVRIDKTVATKETVNSIVYSVKGKTLEITYDATLGVIDGGLLREASRPSARDILIWMKAKNIRPRNTRKGTASFAKGGNSSRNMRTSAFAIARAIRDKGTIKRFGYRGTNVLDNVSPDSKIVKQMMAELLDSAVEEFSLIIDQLKPLPIRITI